MCRDSIAIPRALFLELLNAIRAYALTVALLDQRAYINLTHLSAQLEQIYNHS